MKKKTIVFLCLALLFLISVPQCFSSSLLTGIICIGLCALFAFLAYRSFKMPKKDTTSVINSPNNFTPSLNESSVPPITPPTIAPVNDTHSSSDAEYLDIELINTSSKSDNGINKQALLRAFDNLEPPFDKKSFDSGNVEASFREYLRQDRRTYGVYLNNIQIGDVPEYLTQYIYDKIDLCKGIIDINTFVGKNKEYCVKITLKFSNSDVPSAKTSSTAAYKFITIKLVGVTFKNDDGTERQSILQALKSHDAPYDTELDVSIKEYQFNNERAYGVYVNDMQIGNIPADLVPFVHENIERIESISYIDVYGGGKRDGKPISYGCKITLRFTKDNPPINVPSTLKIND